MELKEKEYKKTFDIKLMKQLGPFLRPYKKHLILLTLVMILVGVVDAALPFLSKVAIDTFIIPRSLEGIVPFSIVYFVLILVLVFLVWALIMLAGKIEVELCYDLRSKGFKNLQRLSLGFFSKNSDGWIMARLTSDCKKIGEVISWGVVMFSWGVSMMMIIGIVLFVMNWQLALIALSVIPVLFFLSVFFQKKILVNYRKVKKNNSLISAAFNEHIMGVRTSKVLVCEDKNLNEFQKLTKSMKKVSVRTAVISSLYLPVVLALGSVGTTLVLIFGGGSVLSEGIGYGTFFAFISYSILFFEPVKEVSRIIVQFQAARASAERVLSLINTKPEVVDSKRVVDSFGDLFEPKKENWPAMKGAVEFKNVSFRYEAGESIFEKFNLTVEEGQTIAIVGKTGSGKSSLVNLLCRFYEPDEGTILIDGRDYKERSLLWLYSNMGYVLQTPHLFKGTIEDNIRYGKPEAAFGEVIDAAKHVKAHEFIMDLKKGYKTEVGEGGSFLSMGQRQLISFARALLVDPKILILDEATSSIDMETEEHIQEAIERMFSSKTGFIIAHRLSTVKKADRILVLDKGKIIEEGTHGELISQNGVYFRLYTNQFLTEDESRRVC